MALSPSDLRGALAFALASFAALVAGVLLASPSSVQAVGIVALLGLVLSLPLLLNWHRPLLFISWNTAIQAFILPGSPRLWMLMAGISLFLTVLENTIDRRLRLQNVRAVTGTLLLFLFVVLVTAALRGGIGIKALGSQTYGGKKYVVLIAAIVGYFALSLVRVPTEKALTYMAGWCLGSLTLAMSNVAYMLGPGFYWLFQIFPVEFATEQALADSYGGLLRRLSGISFAMVGPFCLMLIRYGIRGTMDWRHPWRMLVFTAIIVVSLLGGFRSLLGLYFLLFVFQFSFEGLWGTRYALLLTGALLLAAIVVVPFAGDLPLAMQRSLSFLPIDVNPQARADAEISSEWRFQMWRLLWAHVPQYLWLGKGYALDPMDLYLAQESHRRGLMENYETAMISGEFHSGPLSLLITFGIPGTVTFLAFLVAAWRVVKNNHRYSPPELKDINTFIHAYFLCRVCFFFGVYGDVGMDLAYFTGLVGVSVALNGGVWRPVRAPTPPAEVVIAPAEPLPPPAAPCVSPS